ncbi:hypothetical protein IMZ48_15145 [Candidatus Bathyarchaeota archaeon]|nr:hypothetical protein [Candidatus Bathyarchaeota archaeon]
MQIVLDAGSREWFKTKEIIKTWEKIANIVDIVNQRIFNDEKSPDQCDCLSTAKATCSHVCVCGECGRSTACKDLRDHILGYRACVPCCHAMINEDGKLTETAVWASAMARRSVEASVKNDADKGGWDEDRHNRVLEDSLDDLGRAIFTGDGASFWDTYCQMWRVSPPQGNHPGIISIDAAFALALAQGLSGDIRCHTSGNLAATTWGLNCAKGELPPIILKLIRDYFIKVSELEPVIRQGGTKGAGVREAR